MAGTGGSGSTTGGRSPSLFLAEVRGPVLTLGTIATLEYVSRTQAPISAAEAVYLLVVAVVTHGLGLRPGLLSAAVAIGYQAYFLSDPGEFLRYTPDNLQRFILFVATAPAAALIVGLLARQLQRSTETVAARTMEVAAGEAVLGARLREMSALLSIARVVAGASDLVEALRRVCREMARLTGADTVAAYVLDSEGAQLRPVAGYHIPKAMLEVATKTTIRVSELGGIGAGVLAAEGVVWSDDVPADPRFDFGLARALLHRSAVVVPLALDGQVSGSLYLVWWTARRRLEEPEVAALHAIGQQVESLLRSARLRHALEERAARLHKLARLGHTVSSSLDMGEVLTAIARAAAEFMGVPFVSVWVADEGAGMLTLRAVSDEELAGDLPLTLFGYGEGSVGWVAQHRAPLDVPDVLSDPRFTARGWWQTHRLTSFHGVPVVLEGALLGVLALCARAPVRLAPEDQDLLDIFVGQAAVAIRNARLYADSSLQVERLEILTQLMRVIAASLDPDVILPAVAQAAVSLFPGAACRLWTAEGERIRMRAESGVHEVGDTAPTDIALGEGLVGAVCAAGRPLLLEDASAGARPAEAGWIHAQGFVSAAVLPLVVGSRRVGAVSLFTRDPHAFDAGEVAVLEAIAEQTAVALEKGRLFQDTQERRRLSEALYALAVAMEGSLGIEVRLARFVEGTVEALGLDRLNVFLATPDGAALELAAGTDADPARPCVIPLDEGGAALTVAWKSGETLVVRSDEELAALPPLAPALGAHPGLRSRRFVVIPLTFRGQSVGLVTADNKVSHRPITARTVAQLQLFCQQLAQSVNAARLYQETQHSLAGATLLNEAARTLHRTLDVRRLLPETLASVGQTFDAAGVALVRFDETGSGPPPVVPWGMAAEALARALAPVLRRREAPLIVADLASRPDLVPAEARSPERLGVAAFPVRGRSRVLAGLVLAFPAARTLTEAESRLLGAYADQLAMALDNAALFEEAENKRTQLEQVFASTSDGFLALDLDGRVVALNGRGGDLLGLAPDEVIGRPLAALLDRIGEGPVQGRDAQPGLQAALAGGAEAGDLELAVPARRTIHWHATPTRDLLGATVGATLTLRDVTHEREIDRMKTEFVSTVSHEVRTPLASIQGSLHLLLTDPDLALGEAQRRLMEISITNTDRLVRLIDDILDVSRIEAGQVGLRAEPHQPREFVGPAVEGMAAVARSRGIVVEQVVPEALPPVSVDLDRMIQVLTNLLSNAIKFSPPGGPVTVSAATAQGALELRVTDRGPGIAAGDVGRLFQKFIQLKAQAGREVSGTGLGLAICRGIVEAHGGSIGVESRPGDGATFIVRLPLPEDAGAPHAPPAEADEPPLILVVDDEPDVRGAIREQLEVLGGYRVVEAGRALEAVEVARQRRPDLITMDLMLPDLDGLEAVRLMREHEETRRTPVVMVTAIDLEEGDFGPGGPSACLIKPFTASALLETVRAHLRVSGRT